MNRPRIASRKLRAAAGVAANFSRQLYAFLDQSKSKKVVIGANWHGYFENGLHFIDGKPLSDPAVSEQAYRILRSELQHLREHGAHIYFLLNVPIGVPFSPETWVKHTLTGIQIDPVYSVPRSALLPYFPEVTRRLVEIAKSVDATIIDPSTFLCDATSCRSADENGQPIYKDPVHLRASYVRKNVHYLDEVFDPLPVEAPPPKNVDASLHTLGAP